MHGGRTRAHQVLHQLVDTARKVLPTKMFAQHGGEIGRALRPRHQIGTLHTLHFQQLELEQHLRCIFQVADGVDGEAIEPLARQGYRLVYADKGRSVPGNHHQGLERFNQIQRGSHGVKRVHPIQLGKHHTKTARP